MVDVEADATERTEISEAWGDGDESGRESDGIFAGVLASYDRRGFDRGYYQAINDALALLLLVTEEYLRQHRDQIGLAGVLYPFEEHVERQLRRLRSADPGYVDGGLGI